MGRRSTVPVPLFVGVVIGFCGSVVGVFATFVMLQRGWLGDPDSGLVHAMRWFTFNFGAQAAEMVLTAVALFGVARRAFGGPRALVLVAAWAQVAVLAWYFLQYVVPLGDAGAMTLQKYVWWVIGAGQIAAMVCLVIASRAFTRPSWVTVFAVLGTLATLCTRMTPVIGDLIYGPLGPALLNNIIGLVVGTVIAVSLVAVVHGILRDQPSETPDPHLASRAFRRAALALLLRVVAALALALIAIGVVRERGGIKVLLVVGPAITLIANLGFVWSVLDVERSGLVGMPRVRLTLGAALIAWSAGVQVPQAQAIYARAFSSGSSFYDADQWSIAAPLIAMVGVVLVVWAIHAFAVARQDVSLQGIAVSRGTWFAVLTLATALLPLVLREARSVDTVLAFVLLGVVCSIAAIVALANLMSKAAESLAGAPELPTAQLRQ